MTSDGDDVGGRRQEDGGRCQRRLMVGVVMAGVGCYFILDN